MNAVHVGRAYGPVPYINTALYEGSGFTFEYYYEHKCSVQNKTPTVLLVLTQCYVEVTAASRRAAR